MSDFERPLNERGLKDAPEMARRLTARGVKPDLVVSSTANRALTTARIFADVLGYPAGDILEMHELYAADAETVFDIVQRLAPGAETVLLFGHNPTVTDFVNRAAGVRIDHMPTCATAAVALPGTWQDAEPGSGSLALFDYPKNTAR